MDMLRMVFNICVLRQHDFFNAQSGSAQILTNA
jgi:hypothetical protein